MIFRHLTWFIAFFSLSFNGFTQALPFDAKLPEGAQLGLLIQPLSAPSPSYQHNSQLYFSPASTLKLVTALAAQLELGEHFYFSTQLRKTDQDLQLVFTGDPTLTHQDLYRLFAQYKVRYGTQISGDLWLDNRAFDGYDRAVGLPWDITGVCYSAPSNAIIIDKNCIQASIYTQENGKTRVYVPAHYPITASTQTRAISLLEQQNQHCDLELNVDSNNHYQLSGCLVQRNTPLPLNFAVNNVELYARQVIMQLLKQLGIHLQGEIKITSFDTQLDDNSPLIAEHKSPLLADLLSQMLITSDNLIADTLFKTLGRSFFHQSGRFSNGEAAVKQILWSRAGIDLSTAQLADGSGLSRNNRLTLEQLRQVLNYLYQTNGQLDLLSKLPLSGEQGTLKYRPSMRDKSLNSRILAKSGSLYGTHNMAGFVLDKAQQPKLLFIQFVGDYFIPETEKSTVEPPIVDFERSLYRYLMNTVDQSADQTAH